MPAKKKTEEPAVQAPDFNLCKDGWIPVLEYQNDMSLISREYNFPDALIHAHDIQLICAESSALNLLILRQLEAALLTMLYRYDEQGREDPSANPEVIWKRWESWYKTGKFPEPLIRQYFEQWKDSFNLFDKDNPFQSLPVSKLPDTKKGIYFNCDALKIDGNIGGSANKIPHTRHGKPTENYRLSLPKAARWLLFCNHFSDTSDHAGQKEGWEAKLGLIWLEGDTLFETLMLNMTALCENQAWNAPHPDWENTPPNHTIKAEIPFPEKDLPALYTNRWKHVMFYPEADQTVKNASIVAGTTFNNDLDNAWKTEPMSLWAIRKEDTGEKDEKGKKILRDIVRPDKIINPANAVGYTDPADTAFWRFAASLFPAKSNQTAPTPLLIKWLQLLQEKNCLFDSEITFNFLTCCFSDGNKSKISGMPSVSVSLPKDLLNSKSLRYSLIAEELDKLNSLIDTDVVRYSSAVSKIHRTMDSSTIRNRFIRVINKVVQDHLMHCAPASKNELNLFKQELKKAVLHQIYNLQEEIRNQIPTSSWITDKGNIIVEEDRLRTAFQVRYK